LRSSAYEAVMDLVKNSPKDVYETIQQTFLAILNKMDAILSMEQQGSQVGDYSQHNDFKSLLCATLQVGTCDINSITILLLLSNKEKRTLLYFLFAQNCLICMRRVKSVCLIVKVIHH